MRLGSSPASSYCAPVFASAPCTHASTCPWALCCTPPTCGEPLALTPLKTVGSTALTENFRKKAGPCFGFLLVAWSFRNGRIQSLTNANRLSGRAPSSPSRCQSVTRIACSLNGWCCFGKHFMFCAFACEPAANCRTFFASFSGQDLSWATLSLSHLRFAGQRRTSHFSRDLEVYKLGSTRGFHGWSHGVVWASFHLVVDRENRTLHSLAR